MTELSKTIEIGSRLPGLCLCLALAAAPQARAWAGPPIDETDEADEADEARFAARPPDATPESEPAPLRIATEPSDVEPAATEPEPAIQLAAPGEVSAPTMAPSPIDAGPPIVDRKRPITGVGLITLGGMTLAASSILVMTAMAGPGWLDVEQDHARLAAGLSIPLAAIGSGLVVGGVKSKRRFDRWAADNHLHPPESGNGMLVGGGLMTVGFASLAGFSAQRALVAPTPSRGRWAPTIVAAGFSVVGMAVLAGGMAKRSKFAEWNRTGYVLPGPMALRRGAGIAITGRF